MRKENILNCFMINLAAACCVNLLWFIVFTPSNVIIAMPWVHVISINLLTAFFATIAAYCLNIKIYSKSFASQKLIP